MATVLLSTYSQLSSQLKESFPRNYPDDQRIYIIRDNRGNVKSLTTSILTSIQKTQQK
jgi:hypothetical protein